MSSKTTIKDFVTVLLPKLKYRLPSNCSTLTAQVRLILQLGTQRHFLLGGETLKQTKKNGQIIEKTEDNDHLRATSLVSIKG